MGRVVVGFKVSVGCDDRGGLSWVIKFPDLGNFKVLWWLRRSGRVVLGLKVPGPREL